MEAIMQGIYKITNTVSGHAYVGQSNNIDRRFKEHLNLARDIEKCKDKAFYAALNLYKPKNFVFEVIEEVANEEDLNAREIYWIAYYDTYKNGYNETPGGEGVKGQDGEKHHNHKLTEQEVVDIRRRYAACVESVQDIFESYSDKITKAGFKKIYTWQTWKKILPELYTDAVILWHRENARKLYSFPGEKNPNHKLSDLQVKEIRQRKNSGEAIKQIYKDFEYTGITLGGFRNIAGCYSHVRKGTNNESKRSVS
jgi:group I intron endonuclease